MIQQLISEVSSLWWYAYGMIAGWGLSFSIVVGFLVKWKVVKAGQEL
jgi:hypothetical protein